MKKRRYGSIGFIVSVLLLFNSLGFGFKAYGADSGSAIIVNHLSTKLSDIPMEWINAAKSNLHIAYGHTSHGSQLVTGMQVIRDRISSEYSFNSNGIGGALELRDTPFNNAYDLGNPDFIQWASATRNYLRANPVINVVMWAWCGQVSWASEGDINNYLTLMAGLEKDFPNVRFVYMTGHTDGTGLSGTLHLNNEKIRDYCVKNNKILYDFEDIESYNPDGVYFGDKNTTDECSYNYNGVRGNWAQEWQSTHVEGKDWFDCSPAHTQAVNGNMKGYAAWHLWARLAGWSGSNTSSATPTGTPTIKPTSTYTPTLTPTTKPTVAPTYTPTLTPTTKPTVAPTYTPTYTPTTKPTAAPTYTPTTKPTAVPTYTPTTKPTATPIPTLATATPTPTVTPATSVPTSIPTSDVKKIRIEGPDFVKDSFLSMQQTNANFGDYQYIDVFDRFAIKFSLPESLIGKRILKATISFYVWNQVNYQPNQNMYLYELSKEFDEAVVTWNQAAQGVNWTIPGGDYDKNLPVAVIPHLEGTDKWDHVYYPAVDITKTVEKWAASPEKNLGLLLVNEGLTDIGLKASEYSMGSTPYISVEYTDAMPQYSIDGYVCPDFETSNVDKLKSGFRVELKGTDKFGITDERGYFSITDIPAGLSEYSLRVTKSSYLTRELKNIKFSGTKSHVGAADKPVTIWAGDIWQNGAGDGVINMVDVMNVAKVFNSTKGDALYKENCDLNRDDVINIKDIVIIARNFGRNSIDYPSI